MVVATNIDVDWILSTMKKEEEDTKGRLLQLGTECCTHTSKTMASSARVQWLAVVLGLLCVVATTVGNLSVGSRLLQPATKVKEKKDDISTTTPILYTVHQESPKFSNTNTSTILKNEEAVLRLLKNDTPVVKVPNESSTKRIDPSVVFFDIPAKPHLQVQSIVQASVGHKILNNQRTSPLRNCSVTTQFRVIVGDQPQHERQPLSSTTKTHNQKPWVIQTFSEKGIPKTIGGDEIYVQWVAHTSTTTNSTTKSETDMGVALVRDRLDGTYELDFVRPPLLQQEKEQTEARSPSSSELVWTSKTGTLTIYYDYTCGIGKLMAPRKDRYARAGEVHISFDHSDIPRPPIRDFERPNHDRAIDLSKYDTVYSFGDSLMMQLARQYISKALFHPKIKYRTNVNQALSTPNETESMLAKLREFHGAELRAAAQQNRSVAVIAGSATWDMMRGGIRPGLAAHLEACRIFITTAAIEFPHVDFYWKSPSAIVLHRRESLVGINENWLMQRSRYISSTVPRQVHHAQKKLMAQLRIPYLDLYDAYYLSAPWSRDGDSRHYRDEISALFLSYYWTDLDLKGLFAVLTKDSYS